MKRGKIKNKKNLKYEIYDILDYWTVLEKLIREHF